jgi:hypothetical protein
VTMIFIVILCIQANNQNVLMYSYSGWIYAVSRRFGVSLVLTIGADHTIGISNCVLKNEFILINNFK